MEQQDGSSTPMGAILAVAGGVLLAIGSVLTWAKASIDLDAFAQALGVDPAQLQGAVGAETSKVVSGTSTSDGKLALVCGLVAVILGVVAYSKRERWKVLGVVTMVAGVVGGGIAAVRHHQEGRRDRRGEGGGRSYPCIDRIGSERPRQHLQGLARHRDLGLRDRWDRRPGGWSHDDDERILGRRAGDGRHAVGRDGACLGLGVRHVQRRRFDGSAYPGAGSTSARSRAGSTSASTGSTSARTGSTRTRAGDAVWRDGRTNWQRRRGRAGRALALARAFGRDPDRYGRPSGHRHHRACPRVRDGCGSRRPPACVRPARHGWCGAHGDGFRVRGRPRGGAGSAPSSRRPVRASAWVDRSRWRSSASRVRLAQPHASRDRWPHDARDLAVGGGRGSEPREQHPNGASELRAGVTRVR